MQDRQSRIKGKRRRPQWMSVGSMARVLISWTVLCSLPFVLVAYEDPFQSGSFANDTATQVLPPPEENVTPLPTDSPRPSPSPSLYPSFSPSTSFSPTTSSPTETMGPSPSPSAFPSYAPTSRPSSSPSDGPSMSPTFKPTPSPTSAPTEMPTSMPTPGPTWEPTFTVTSLLPSVSPSQMPVSASPTVNPTTSPTVNPTPAVTREPTFSPTFDAVDPDTSSPTKPTDASPSPTTALPPKPTLSPTTPNMLSVPLPPFQLMLAFDSTRRKLLLRTRQLQASGSELEAIAEDLETTLADYLLESMSGFSDSDDVSLLDVILSVTPVELSVSASTSGSRENPREKRENIFVGGRFLQASSTEATFLVEGDTVVGVAEDAEVDQKQLDQEILEASRTALEDSAALTEYLQMNSETTALQSVSSAQAEVLEESSDDGPSVAAIVVGFSLVALAAASLVGYGYVFWKKQSKKKARRKREREQGVYDPRKSSTVASVAPTASTRENSRALRASVPQSAARIAAVTAATNDDDSSSSSYNGLESESSETERDQFARELKLAASLDRRAWEDYEEKRQLYDEEEVQSHYPAQYAMAGGFTPLGAQEDSDGFEVVDEKHRKGFGPEGSVGGTRSVRSFPYGDEVDPSVEGSEQDDVFQGIEWNATGIAAAPRRHSTDEGSDAEFDPAKELLESLASMSGERPPPSKNRLAVLRSSPVSDGHSSAAVRTSPIAEGSLNDIASNAAVDRDSLSRNESNSTGKESGSFQTDDMIREVHKLSLYVKRYERKRERRSLEEELEKNDIAGSDITADPEVSYDVLSDSVSALRKSSEMKSTSRLPQKLEAGQKARPEADRVSSWSTESNSGFLERESELFFSGGDASSARPLPSVRDSSNPLKAAKALLSRFQNDKRFHPEQASAPAETPPPSSNAVRSAANFPRPERPSARSSPGAVGSPPQRGSSEVSSGYQSTEIVDNTSKSVLRRANEVSRDKETPSKSSQVVRSSPLVDDHRHEAQAGLQKSPAQQKAREVFASRYGLINNPAKQKGQSEPQRQEGGAATESREAFVNKYGLQTSDIVKTPQQTESKSRDAFSEQTPTEHVEHEEAAASESRDKFMRKYGLDEPPRPVESPPPQESIEVSHVERNNEEKKTLKRSNFLQRYGLRGNKAASHTPEDVEISHHIEQEEIKKESTASSQERAAFQQGSGMHAISRSGSEEDIQSSVQSDESRLGITPFSVQTTLETPALRHPIAESSVSPIREAGSPAPEVSRLPSSQKEKNHFSGKPSRDDESPGPSSLLNQEVSPERVLVSEEPPAKRTREETRTKTSSSSKQKPPRHFPSRDAIKASRRKRSLASLRHNDSLLGTGSDSVNSPHAPSDESTNGPKKANDSTATTPRNPRAVAAPRSRTPKSNSKISGILSAFEQKPPNPIFPSGVHWQYQG